MSKQVTLMTDAIPYQEFAKLIGKSTGAVRRMIDMHPTPSEHAAAVLNLVDSGVIGWDDPEVVTVLRSALKHGAPRPNWQQRNCEPLKPYQIAPSGRMTKAERSQIPRIHFELALIGKTYQ